MLTMYFKEISLKVPGREQPTHRHVTERLAGILRDKTMDDKLMYIPNDDKQN